VPKLCKDLQKYSLNGDLKKAIEIQNKLHKLNKLLFINTNPIPIKYACFLAGICDKEIRLPLTLPEEDLQFKIKEELKNLNII